MTFNVAADLTKLDQEELYALQAGLEIESTNTELSLARQEILRDHLARVDREILTRAMA